MVLFFMAHTKPGTRAPELLTIPRPGRDREETEERKTATPEEMKAFFGARGRIRYTPKEPAT